MLVSRGLHAATRCLRLVLSSRKSIKRDHQPWPRNAASCWPAKPSYCFSINSRCLDGSDEGCLLQTPDFAGMLLLCLWSGQDSPHTQWCTADLPPLLCSRLLPCSRADAPLQPADSSCHLLLLVCCCCCAALKVYGKSTASTPCRLIDMYWDCFSSLLCVQTGKNGVHCSTHNNQ